MTRPVLAFWVCISGIIPLTGTAALAAAHEQTPRPQRFKANDKQFRELAVTSTAPTYPHTSLTKKVTGVVVAAIRTDPKGASEAVEILQSPDSDTGRAVHDAVMQWVFKPMGMGAEGIVVFYFHIEGSRGVVLSPAEMRKVTNPRVNSVARDEEPPVKLITEAEFRGLSSRSRPVVLDIRDRETFAEGHEKGAVNITFGEILTRALAELRVSSHIVIDCRDAPDVCAMAAHQLSSSGFSQVSILRR